MGTFDNPMTRWPSLVPSSLWFTLPKLLFPSLFPLLDGRVALPALHCEKAVLRQKDRALSSCTQSLGHSVKMADLWLNHWATNVFLDVWLSVRASRSHNANTCRWGNLGLWLSKTTQRYCGVHWFVIRPLAGRTQEMRSPLGRGNGSCKNSLPGGGRRQLSNVYTFFVMS